MIQHYYCGEKMDFGQMIGDSFTYAKEGVIDKVNRWGMLIIATLILMLPLTGYLMKIYRGDKPAPEVEDWGKLIIDGIMLTILFIIFAIPLGIVGFIITLLGVGTATVGSMTGDPTAAMAGIIGAGIFGLIFMVIAIIIGLILPIAAIRFARSGSFGEAINISAILAQIGKIGWVSYIIALIIGGLVVGIPIAILEFILLFIVGVLTAILSFIGLIIGLLICAAVALIVIPVIAVFQARYLTLIFDSTGAA
jgi:hypothetical protein